MAKRNDTESLQIPKREIREEVRINVVRGERFRILSETERFEPLRDIRQDDDLKAA